MPWGAASSSQKARASAPNSSSRCRSPARHPLPTERMDILVVDDEKIIRDATIQVAEDAGHYAEAAPDAVRALEMLRDSTFDLVLLDLHLGRENGLDLLDQIQKKFPNVAIVVFTAAATIRSAVDAMRRGALDFLEKP